MRHNATFQKKLKQNKKLSRIALAWKKIMKVPPEKDVIKISYLDLHKEIKELKKD